LKPGKNGPKMAIVISKRTDVHPPHIYNAEEHQIIVNLRKSYIGQAKPGDVASVGLIGRIIARFKGEALPGEKEAPKALFANTGMHFIPPEPLPPVPANYKGHPERDLVNFPFPQRHLYPSKMHFWLLPASWFQGINKVTGSSGPYALIFSLGAFIVNKEFLVWDLNMALLCCWLFYFYIIRNAWEPTVDQYFYNIMKDHHNKHKKVIADDLATVQNFKKIQAARKDALVTAKENFPSILKENMELQLEVAYRKNIQKIATELKRRVDYLKDTESVKSRLERNIYIHQIIDGVQRQLDNNENGIKDAYLDYCIDQLKGLATKEGAH